MTEVFVPVMRQLPHVVATADVSISAPPALPRSPSPSPLVRLVPILISLGSLGVMAAAFFSGPAATRSPTFLAFPMMMLVSMTATAVAGRGRRQSAGIDADRVAYLGYLGGLRKTIIESAAAQRSSLSWSHPDPGTLWTLIGGSRMWERHATDSDFCVVRVGVGIRVRAYCAPRSRSTRSRSKAMGGAPCARSASWNRRNEKRSPSFALASSRRARICNFPSVYAK